MIFIENVLFSSISYCSNLTSSGFLQLSNNYRKRQYIIFLMATIVLNFKKIMNINSKYLQDCK